jgi:radical SAM superfamily enzyme YgiQ (UPF0313 family)
MIDVLFVTPNNTKNYQALANKYSAIEPPTWSLLLAQSVRSVGFTCNILDVTAENLSYVDVVERIEELNPKLLCFVVYGQNVSSGIANMEGAVDLANCLSQYNKWPIALIGSYAQALPYEVLKSEEAFDIVFPNEGVLALRNLLSNEDWSFEGLKKIKGIGFRLEDGTPFLTEPEDVVTQERMDIDLPGYAWDLLPYKNKPFDLYRSPLWHGEYQEEKRSPYAAIQTSLGCKFHCHFCMINLINRKGNEQVGIASHYSGMRFWSPELILKEFDKLASMGVETIRIVDEMFLLNKKYYLPLVEELAKRDYAKNLRMWAYSRIDTVSNPEILTKIRTAGIKWLCLGIESGDKKIRLEAAKGKFEDVNIFEVIKRLSNADIEVMGNYMFGLPGDTLETMQKTLDLSIQLNTVGWNAYATMAFPGSDLYDTNDEKRNYSEYAYLSYDTNPIATESLSKAEILKFRDEAFLKYHTNPKFIDKIYRLYGKVAVDNVVKMTQLKLKRKLCD